MSRRKLSLLETLRLNLQTVTARDVMNVSIVAVALILVLAFAYSSGLNVGSHIWRRGWWCGPALKGGIFCAPDPASKTEG